MSYFKVCPICGSHLDPGERCYQHPGRQGGKGFGKFRFRLHCTLTKEENQVKIPEKYADTPNLWRLACELSKFKNPYKTLDMVIAIAGPMLKEDEDGQK